MLIAYPMGRIDIYLIASSRDSIILGGTHQKFDFNTSIDPIDTKFIHDGCLRMVPTLKNAEILSEWVGLRPGRNTLRLVRTDYRSGTSRKANKWMR